MGKFEHIMLCSDLDGTLLKSDESISEKNIQAIEYFKGEGGIFTFVTGRSPSGSVHIAKWVMPNCPSGLFNGAGIFDYRTNELLWGEYLDENAKKVVELVEKNIPELGILVCTDNYYYVHENNRLVKSYYSFEKGEEKYAAYNEIDERWKKTLFITDPENVEIVRQLIKNSEYCDDYSFMQSSVYYYEMLPKGLDKNDAILRICNMEGITDIKRVCIGDSENDISMLKNADLGIAPKNAADSVKAAADIVLDVTNDEDAIAEVIYNIL